MSDSTIPPGYCQCGCGKKTTIAKYTNTRWGHKKNQPVNFLTGHNSLSFNGIASNIKLAYQIDEKTGCWNWRRSINSCGYGTVGFNGKSVQAHRYLYELLRGTIPEGMHLDHLCRNRSCVNPEHLEPVTPAINTQRGSTAKLSLKEVAEIRWLRGLNFTYAAIAEIFNISIAQVGRIVNGECWT